MLVADIVDFHVRAGFGHIVTAPWPRSEPKLICVKVVSTLLLFKNKSTNLTFLYSFMVFRRHTVHVLGPV